MGGAVRTRARQPPHGAVELDNLRTVLEWGKATEASPERVELALRLAAPLYAPWFRRGYGREGQQHFTALLSHRHAQRPHLYTVPGQVFYDASRKLILKGVDGVIFVADSQEERMDANIEALDNLVTNLTGQGYDFKTIPYVLQFNKRDLPTAMPVEDMKKILGRRNEPIVEASAWKGVGVFETLRAVAKVVLQELNRGQ